MQQIEVAIYRRYFSNKYWISEYKTNTRDSYVLCHFICKMPRTILHFFFRLSRAANKLQRFVIKFNFIFLFVGFDQLYMFKCFLNSMATKLYSFIYQSRQNIYRFTLFLSLSHSFNHKKYIPHFKWIIKKLIFINKISLSRHKQCVSGPVNICVLLFFVHLFNILTLHNVCSEKFIRKSQHHRSEKLVRCQNIELYILAKWKWKCNVKTATVSQRKK